MSPQPCSQCEHLRVGKSIVKVAYEQIMARFKPELVQIRTQQLQTEQQKASSFMDDRSSAMATKVDTYSGCPSAPDFRYCGVDEFNDAFYVLELKNLDDGCQQFATKGGAANKLCSSCRHLRPPNGALIAAVEQVLRRREKSQRILDGEITPMLKARAESEFTDCVDHAGVLTGRPAMLPLCEAHSRPDEARFVIGPIVNAGGRCAKWEAGSHQDDARATLQAIVARMQQVVGVWERSIIDANLNLSNRTQICADAETHVLEYCFAQLGYDQDFIASICGRHADINWSATWSGPRGTALVGGPAATPGAPMMSQPAPMQGMQPQAQTPQFAQPPQLQPFALQANVPYQHPMRPDIVLTIGQYGMQLVAIVQTGGVAVPFDLATCQPNMWVQLNSPQGPLPVVLLSQLPVALYASWLF